MVQDAQSIFVFVIGLLMATSVRAFLRSSIVGAKISNYGKRKQCDSVISEISGHSSKSLSSVDTDSKLNGFEFPASSSNMRSDSDQDVCVTEWGEAACRLSAVFRNAGKHMDDAGDTLE